MGGRPEDDKEIYELEELFEAFSLERIAKTAAVFDYEKLKWYNGMYMRSLPKETVVERAKRFLLKAGYDLEKYSDDKLEYIIELYIERAKTLAELAQAADYFFVDELEFEEKVIKKHLSKEANIGILEQLKEALSVQEEFSIAALEETLRELSEKLEVGFGKLANPLRASLTGKAATPGIFDVLYCLGKETCLERIEKGIEFIKGRI